MGRSMAGGGRLLFGLALVLSLVSCGGGDADDAEADAAQARARALALTPQQAALAKWTAPITLPLIPVAGSVLENGKLLFWSADERYNFDRARGLTFTSLFDPATNTATLRQVNETGHDMFCPGTTRLPDGRLLVNGGIDTTVTSIYDPVADSWTRSANMSIPRGYNANAPLADGSVLTLGGSWRGGLGGKHAEIYTPQGGWRRLPNVTIDPFLLDGAFKNWWSDSHAWLIPTGNGKVLFAGPSPEMRWIDTRGDGRVEPAGRRGDDTPSFAGNAVMYDAGKILKVGGAYRDTNLSANAHAYIIDTRLGTAAVRKIGSMAYPRVYNNSVVLPNGQVLVVGGQTVLREFTNDNAVLVPEIFDPSTETFTPLPAMSVARNYHSIGLLLPDGRVVSGGGGLCGTCNANQPNIQILSPPYLFNANGTPAVRPVVTAAPQQVGYGTTMNVSTDSPVTAFSMIRLGANTHSVDNDQRRVSLEFTSSGTGSYQVAVPSNPGILLPGQWMLFAMNANGTPSVAKFVTVSATGAPTLANPGNAYAAVGAPLQINIAASTTSGTLSYGATGLPPGVGIDPASGVLSGTPSVGGAYYVNVNVSNGSQTVSTGFTLDVSGATHVDGTGLLAQYFGNTTQSGAPLAQNIEAPHFAWGSADPVPGASASNFSARWSGFIEGAGSGSTRLQTVSADGVRVWVDGNLVIDDWTPHATKTHTADVTLAIGRRHAIQIDYYDAGGGATLQLNWLPPGAQAFVPVPAVNLFPSAAQPTTNLALGKPSRQWSTSTTANSAASSGNDGNLATRSLTTSVNQIWWQVDLGVATRIDVAHVWNRTDCCTDRLRNFVVLLGPTDMAGRTLANLMADPNITKRQIGMTTAVPNIAVPVRGVGRFMRVQLTSVNDLGIGEFEAFGSTSYSLPVVTSPGNQQSAVGNTAYLPVAANDPGGNALFYSASGLPVGASIDPATGVITGTLVASGTYDVRVTATNSTDLAGSASFQWTVVNPPPQVTPPPAPSVVSGGLVQYAPALSGGNGALFSWNFGDGTGDTPYTGSIGTNHVFAAPGVYTVTLTIRSADGRTSTLRFLQAVRAGGGGTPGRAAAAIAIEPRGGDAARLWVVNPDNDSVTVFDTASNQRLAEVPVGTAPRSVAVANDGRIWVVNKQGDSISVISPANFAVVQTIPLPRGSQPYGLLFAPSGGSAFVTLEATGRLLRLDGSTGAETASLAVGDRPRHLALTPAGDRLLVSRFITPPLPGEGTAQVQTTSGGQPRGGEVLLVDPVAMTVERSLTLAHSDRSDAENQGRGIPNYLGAAAISPDGRSAWIPSKQDNILRGSLRDGRPLDFQNTVRAVSSRIDLASQSASVAERIDHDNAGLASAALYDASGVYLFVALETSREVAVLDAAGQRELFRTQVGLAPQGLAMSPDGLSLYVSNFMDRSVSVVDLRPLVQFGEQGASVRATVPTVVMEKLAANVLRGKQLFYDARDPRLARDAYLSCASCHDDGGHDGRTWDFTGQGEGLRNTIALRGRGGMRQGFMHWSANFDEAQDFEGQIRALSEGTGLMSDADFNAGTRSQPLGDAKAGRSADLDALAAYLRSLDRFAPSPARPQAGQLSAAAEAGRGVFQSAGCGNCHAGIAFTASAGAPAMKDVGTVKPSSGQRLGNVLLGIDIPSLRDVWATAPYLHDGSAATLGDAVRAHADLSLSAAEVDSVVAYLREIGGDEPGTVPPASAVSCGPDQGTCELPAGIRVIVFYGANGSYVSRAGVSASIACSAQSFGGVDPLPGTAKSCLYVVEGQQDTGSLPPGATLCANEGALCSLPAGKVATVYYGANGQFNNVTQLAGTLHCDDRRFGNPISGVAKTCSYQLTGVSSAPPADAQYCSANGGLCTLPVGSTATVYFGAVHSFASKSGITGAIGCDVASFEVDPNSGASKYCAYVITATAAGSESGFLAQYYPNTTLSGPAVVERTERPSFSWGSAAPAPGMPSDRYSIRWSGYLTGAEGITTLRTISDDGVRMWVDGKLLIDNWTAHAPTTNTATVSLSPTRKTAVTIEYFDGTGAAQLYFSWQPPGTTAFAAIPITAMTPALPASTQNLALGKPATQSSTEQSAVAARAVDNKTDGVFSGLSVTLTAATAQPWWQTDLGQISRIDAIKLWNRTDCCSDRLRNFVVFVSPNDMTGRTLDALRADPEVLVREVGATSYGGPTIGVPIEGSGRFVRVQLLGTANLSLAEVQVFGSPSGNLALGKPAQQSGTASGGVASRAVDGNTGGIFANGSVSLTDAASGTDWWQVDLGRASRIDALQIWSRRDCCADALRNLEVLVSDTDMTGRTLQELIADPNVTALPYAEAEVLPSRSVAIGRTARYVRLQLTGGGALPLAEVQVFGTPSP